MNETWITVTGFLNRDTVEDSLGRLGMAALDSGISDAALRALVRLTCQAHDVQVHGLGVHRFEERHLEEMRGISLIYRPNPGEVKMV
ncbi:hypothetical protein [Streptomyces cucumeris]|uniref:hypothetical protein n=1 Tax=Streptomyces cucumeris TaxID=2962890 RepID=UPI0020C91429|nr:hypothetical protein [Streptomyces sp. NEAU-Y11]MCP9209649.1 hypothetical protein [Streptomyces sp. NEAU-Y11]